MSSTTDIARRPGGSLAAAQSSVVAIRNGQAEFDDKQKAALVAMGVSAKVTRAELAVFFHQCRTLRLDPFSKQIYLIHRRTRENGEWVEKPTTQVGIDGFRVTRDRICEERGLSVSYEDTLWYDGDNQSYDVWLWDEPPAACKFVVLVDDGKRVRRFPSVLRFNEYCQKNKDGDRLGRWRDGHSHQIEKCAEADALRRAFPNDLSGVILEDAAPLDDPDAPPPAPQRATAEQIRNRRPQPQPVQSEVVDAQVVDDVPPWEPPASSQPQAPATPQQPAQPDGDPRAAILAQFDLIGVAGNDQASYLTRLIGKPVTSVDGLKLTQAQWFATRLAGIGSRDELEAAAVAAEARREQDGTPGE